MMFPKSRLWPSLPSHIFQAIDQGVGPLNSAGFDRWGLEPEALKKAVSFVWPLYHSYFRVKVHGAQNIPTGRVMLIANHSGQVPLDAMMIGIALLDQLPHPRIGRSMIEHWVPTLPFISDLFSRCGQLVGDPHNCLDLLEHEQCLLVFPEGVKGISKPFKQRYQLQKFGTGFARLAHASQTPIVPVGVVGCEEVYPTLFHSKVLAKLFKAPGFPITPFFPWLGVLGALPLPNPIDIYFGEPIAPRGDHDLGEAELEMQGDVVKESLSRLIAKGLSKRSGYFHQRRVSP